MSKSIIGLHAPMGKCSRCNDAIFPGARVRVISVSHEIWKSNRTAETTYSRVALAFCARCGPLFDFKSVAVGRLKSEEDLLLEREAEFAELEHARPSAANALNVAAETLSDEQIRGWILEQDYANALADNSTDAFALR